MSVVPAGGDVIVDYVEQRGDSCEFKEPDTPYADCFTAGCTAQSVF